MKYIAVLHQDGEGCDYTIGCGTRVEYTEAESMKEAFENFSKDLYWADIIEDHEGYDGNPLAGEMQLESMTIYQVGVTDDGEMYQNLFNMLEAKANSAAAIQRRKDEAELERLQRKLRK